MERFIQILIAVCVLATPVISLGSMYSDEELARLSKEADDIRKTLDGFYKNLSGELATKYKVLRNTLEVYAGSHADNESNSPGTGWAKARNSHEKAILKEFIDYFKKMESQQMKVQSELDFKQKDMELNRLYQALQKNKNLDTEDAAAVDRLGIKNTQRNWIKYRDAWLAFAMLKFPTVSTSSLSTALTVDRISVLAKITTD